MSDVILPPWVPIASFGRRYIDSTGVSVGEYSGLKVTAGKGGDRLGAAIEFTPQGYSSVGTALNARTVQQFLMRMRGRQNRAYIADPSRRRAGTFPTGELLSNNTFGNGLTDWVSSNPANLTLTVSDRAMRATRLSTLNDHTIRPTGVTTVPYAPYAFRVFCMQGLGAIDFKLRAGTLSGGNDIVQELTDNTTQQLHTLTMITPVGTTYPNIVDGVTGGRSSHDYMEFPYTSFSRCLLVDVGVNALAQANNLDHSSWAKENSTAVDSGALAPNTAGNQVSQLTEDLTSAVHGVTQLVTGLQPVAHDVCFAVAVKAGTRSFVQLIVSKDAPNHFFACFDLATGAIGETGQVGSFTQMRTPVAADLGNGWWYLAIIARKTDATATQLTAFIRIGTSNVASGGNYAGNGTGHIFTWQATLAPSGVPVRLCGNTTPTSGGSPTGSSMIVKGAPANGADLLLPGDQFEVITTRGSELKIVTAPVMSNGAGIANIRFEPPLRGLCVSDAPVIVHEPFGYYMVPEQGLEWARDPGVIRASLQVEEAS